MTEPKLSLATHGIRVGNISVRLTRGQEEVLACQRLRYQVFYEEFGAKPLRDMEALGRDYDEFDDYCDHLVVVDHNIGDGADAIIGTYRLFREDMAKRMGRFYSDDEYDIRPLVKAGVKPMELGRSCVNAEYRTRPVLQILWQGIAEYIDYHQVDVLFGCASFHGTDVDTIREELSYLYHYHKVEGDTCPVAVKGRYINMDMVPKDQLDPKKCLMNLPPLIKGYLRLGASVGDGAIIDEQFNTVDVCIVVRRDELSGRYAKHYDRKIASSKEHVVAPLSDDAGTVVDSPA